jgi:hypothetical protein
VDQGVERALHELDVTSARLLDDAPARLAALRAGTGLKLPDCCVLLAAKQRAVRSLRSMIVSPTQRPNVGSQSVPPDVEAAGRACCEVKGS